MKKHIKAIVCFLIVLTLIQLGFAQTDNVLERYNNTQVNIFSRIGR